MATKTKKSKKTETPLDNDEGSSSGMIEKKLKRTLTTAELDKINPPTLKKIMFEKTQSERSSIIYHPDNIIQKTKNDNDELKKLLISKELIDVKEEELKVNYKNSEIINLPQLSGNKFQDRIHIREGKLPFICRRNCVEIFRKVIDSIDEQNESRGLYIFGPSGLGKSYSIYYLVAQLRLHNNLRVTYINSCEEWWGSHENVPYEFLLNELICTFSNDELSPLTVADWIEFVIDGLTERLSNKFDKLTEDSEWVEEFMMRSGNSIEERFKTFIIALRTYVRENRYLWIWVFDQHNALHKYDVLAKYPFSLVEVLPTFLDKRGLIIVSASANNEVFPKAFESWEKFSMYSGYTDDEFLEWCKMRNYKIDRDPRLKSQLDSIRLWTNSYPLELDLWHMTKGSNHNELISLNSCVVSMMLGSSKPGAIYGMNRQFMYEKSVSETDEGGDTNAIRKTIVAIHPLAQQAIIDCHPEHPFNELRDMVSAVFNQDEFSNDTKGRFAELYIKMLLEYTKTCEFKIRNRTVAYDLNFKLSQIIKFIGNYIPTESFNVEKNALFLPQSDNYPGVDFLIWDHYSKILFSFQVTIGSLANHRKSRDDFMTGKDGKDSLKNKWATLCNTKGNKVKFIWLAPDDILKNDKSKDSLHLLFSDIKNQFPVLGDL
ncbi:25064_t:CDS:2 [Gigaspora margarita]|uniref:25064_t:CDS:1 n=1 Tax=Gigaspora margarita TaxID=4874 RepID=A0ABM8W3U8_GIGMA|nr:25064_t:CDS:2 [Gigaspora margarita]